MASSNSGLSQLVGLYPCLNLSTLIDAIDFQRLRAVAGGPTGTL